MHFILAHIVTLILWLCFSVPCGQDDLNYTVFMGLPELWETCMSPERVSTLGSWFSYLYNYFGVKLREMVDEDGSPWCPWFHEAPHGSQNPSWVWHAPQDVRCLQFQQFPANSKRQWPQLCHHGSMVTRAGEHLQLRNHLFCSLQVICGEVGGSDPEHQRCSTMSYFLDRSHWKQCSANGPSDFCLKSWGKVSRCLPGSGSVTDITLGDSGSIYVA